MPRDDAWRYVPLERDHPVLVRGCLGCLADALVLYRVLLHRTWTTTLCAACAAAHQQANTPQHTLWLFPGGEETPSTTPANS